MLRRGFTEIVTPAIVRESGGELCFLIVLSRDPAGVSTIDPVRPASAYVDHSGDPEVPDLSW